MEKPGMGRFPLSGAGLLAARRALRLSRRRGLLKLLAALSLLRISPAGLSAQSPRGPYWKDLPPALTAGQEIRLALHPGGGKRPENPLPPPVPPRAVMEALPPEGEEILAFRLIPLEGPFFILPGFKLSPEQGAAEAPALKIPVNPLPRTLREEKKESPAEGRELPPFPLAESAAGAWSRGILERSRAFWEAGQAVEALAELRRHERDHIAGFSLAAPRRELERALRLEGEEDEIFRHPLLLIPAAILCLLLAALSLSLPAGLRRRPGGRRLWIFRGASLAFSILALLCLLRLGTVRSLGTLPAYFRGKSPRQALARGAPVYQVPEDQGTRIASLQEGRRLLIYEVRDGWAYAESPREGISGWIRTSSCLIY